MDTATLFYKINELLRTKKEVILVAIDGQSASGKTTLARRIQEEFDCNVFAMDDYFLRPCQRTKERLHEVGGNVDYERFYKEVLVPAKQKSEVFYQPYCCKTQTLLSPMTIKPKRLVIIEGAYSLHPYFNDPYQLKVLCLIKEELQRERILKRNGALMLNRFMTEWIPKENIYLKELVDFSQTLQLAEGESFG